MSGASDPPRWDTSGARATAREVTDRLLGGRALDDLGLTAVDGRLDLRGLPADAAKPAVQDAWALAAGVAWDRLDLRGADLRTWRFERSRFTDCRFDGADCRDWRLWACEVEDCSFRDANLAAWVIGRHGGGAANRFRRVDFGGADHRVDLALGAEYDECEFAGAELTDVSFLQCTFRRCRFGGLLRGVEFDGRLVGSPAPSPPPDAPRPVLEQVDLTAAELSFVELYGYRLDGLALPDDPGLRVVHDASCVFDRALAVIVGADPVVEQLRDYLAQRRPAHAADPTLAPDALFNRRDFAELGDELLALLADEVFAAAQASCP